MSIRLKLIVHVVRTHLLNCALKQGLLKDEEPFEGLWMGFGFGASWGFVEGFVKDMVLLFLNPLKRVWFATEPTNPFKIPPGTLLIKSVASERPLLCNDAASLLLEGVLVLRNSLDQWVFPRLGLDEGNNLSSSCRNLKESISGSWGHVVMKAYWILTHGLLILLQLLFGY